MLILFSLVALDYLYDIFLINSFFSIIYTNYTSWNVNL